MESHYNHNLQVEQPLTIMTLLKSSISLLAATGAVAFPRYPMYKRADVDSFISSQTPISLQGVLNNIGDNGTLVSGASSGVVVASPSKDDPDYFYTWTRDAGMTLAALIEELRAGNADLESTIQNYVDSQATLQSVDNPSGGLSDGSGLGEPKFNVDLSQFTEEWGRPQSDGPALRASALIAYGNYLAKNGSTSVVSSNIWPIVQNDLAYVGEYWNETGFDLWEEVEGTSFFTTAVQFKALVEGAAFAESLGETCDSCSVAPQILCHLQEFWDGSAIVSNSPANGRAGVDANSVIASLNLFDPEAGCDDATFQPCSAKALANHKVYVDSFRDIYGINSGIGAGKAVATGRYSEDTYQGGNPWYLTTLAAAEQLYDALYQWDKQGSIDITNVSLPFFTDLVNNTQAGSFASSSSEYESITSAVKGYADGFVGIVQAYTPSDGALAEQFSRDSGDPASATFLTWSFASFLTTVARRNGQVPLSWGSSTASEVPSQCSGETVAGTYASPSVGSW